MFDGRVHIGAARQLKTQIARRHIQGIADGRHIRRAAELLHRQPGEKMVHGRVAHDHRIGDLLAARAGLGAKLGHQAVERVCHPGLEYGAAVGVFIGVGDPADHVLAVGDLGVDRAALGQRLPGGQRHQVGRDLGGADIHGQPKQRRAERCHGDHLAVVRILIGPPHAQARRPALRPQLRG